jgi:hypothetical protein
LLDRQARDGDADHDRVVARQHEVHEHHLGQRHELGHRDEIHVVEPSLPWRPPSLP